MILLIVSFAILTQSVCANEDADHEYSMEDVDYGGILLEDDEDECLPSIPFPKIPPPNIPLPNIPLPNAGGGVDIDVRIGAQNQQPQRSQKPKSKKQLSQNQNNDDQRSHRKGIQDQRSENQRKNTQNQATDEGASRQRNARSIAENAANKIVENWEERGELKAEN